MRLAWLNLKRKIPPRDSEFKTSTENYNPKQTIIPNYFAIISIGLVIAVIADSISMATLS